MSLNVEEPYKEEEVLYQVQVRLNSRGRERVLKVKVYDCAPPLYIHSCRGVTHFGARNFIRHLNSNSFFKYNFEYQELDISQEKNISGKIFSYFVGN